MEENEKEKGCGGNQEGGRNVSEGQRANQNVHPKNALVGQTPRREEGGESHEGENGLPARVVGSMEGYWHSEVTSQQSSDSGSCTDSNSEEEEMGTDRVKSKNIPIRNKAEP